MKKTVAKQITNAWREKPVTSKTLGDASRQLISINDCFLTHVQYVLISNGTDLHWLILATSAIKLYLQ